MSALKLFWWAPSRDLRLAWPEVKSNPGVWVRLGLRTGRLATNFGDELSSHVVEAVTGRKVEWSHPRSADLVAVGSVLGLYASLGSGAAVWGSGVREPLGSREGDSLRQRLGPILAVRGKSTRDALGLPHSTALGDPGILAPLFRVRPSVRKRRVLAIPHFRAWASAQGRQTLRQVAGEDIEIAEPTLHPKAMIERISNASLVLTSSLHGLILGHSLGVPTQLVSWENDGHQEPDFKYEDYFSSIGRAISRVPVHSVLDPTELKRIYESCDGEAPALEKATSLLSADLMKVIRTL